MVYGGSNPSSRTIFMNIRVEYDDGINPQRGMANMVSVCKRKGRARGFYAIMPDGTEREIKIGFMRVGEMPALEKFLNECAGEGNWHTS